MRSPDQSSAPAGGLLPAEDLALFQGRYFLATGIWPLVHIRSFEAVTGPKTDRWLARTVGALIGVIGGTLVLASRGRGVSPEIRSLASGSAAVLAAVDLVYVAKNRIPPIYLFDAAAEVALLAGWAVASPRSRASMTDRGKATEPV